SAMDALSEQHTVEENLLINRLESLMIVAGGISHDFNNVLTMLFGHLSLARRLSKDESLSGILAEAEKACIRAKNLAGQMMEFSRGGNPVQEIIYLPELVKGVAQFVLKGTKATHFFTSSKTVSPVMASESQLSQVIINLIVNSVQAMPNGGVITVGVENTTVDSAGGIPLKEGAYVRIWVEDEGVGIPERFIPKIFDCHFSTKPAGRGLGLTISQMIVKSHGGCITVRSEEERGSVFSVYLPAL
ncbi:MAG: two-component system sensor histidine kinase NtrB, partial [Candidatus Latescibacterota bacterium]